MRPEVISFVCALLGALAGGIWAPWLAWHLSLDPLVRRNLPPRSRPWWIP